MFHSFTVKENGPETQLHSTKSIANCGMATSNHTLSSSSPHPVQQQQHSHTFPIPVLSSSSITSSIKTNLTSVTSQSKAMASNSNGIFNISNGLRECAGCLKRITERFLLKALDLYWHEDCLKCGCCDCRLGEVGSTLYTKANLILCKRDYLRWVLLIRN